MIITAPFFNLPGIMAAAVLTLTASLIARWPRRGYLVASLAIILATPLALGGFWFSDNFLGISDWDYYFSYHHFLRQSILEYHTFPLWNPYTCGGTAALGDPEFPVLTVTFPLELVLGVEKGLRAAIYLSVITGGLGMIALGKRLKLSPLASLVAAAGFCFGSVNLLEIVEGHQNILAAMWLPWIFWAWYAAYQERVSIKDKKANLWNIFTEKYTILCAVFLALTFYAGGIYLLMYTAMAFIGLVAVSRHRRQAALVTLSSGSAALGLAAVKLVPVFFWLSEFQDQAYASSTFTLAYVHQILLGRYLHGSEDVIPNQGGGWHEYGAYVGPALLALAVLGASAIRRRRLVRVLVGAAMMAILISSAGPIIKPLFDQAPFLPRSNISRFILLAVIPLCLLAGIGLDHIRLTSAALRTALRYACLAAVAVDLMTLSYPLSQQAFTVPRSERPPPPAPSPLAYSAFDYKTRVRGIDETRAYEATLAGYGSLSYCAVLGPAPAVRTIHDEVDNALLSVKTKTGQFGSFALTFWNPNMAAATVTLPADGTVVLNANYAQGWLANGWPAEEMAGRVGVAMLAGTHQVTFRYRAPGLAAGISLTAATLLLIGGQWLLNSLVKRQRIG